MALHDVDKESQDRASPTPNTSDVILDGAMKAHKTISSHYGTDADTTPGRLQMQNKQILGNDGTTNVTLYGFNPALQKWGFFVTQTGTEVTTNTDLTKFVFNSSQDIFKIVQTGVVTIADPGAGNTGSVTITHNLGFVPIVLGYAQGGLNVQLPIFNGFNADGTCTGLTYVSLASTTIFTITNFKSTTGPGNIGQTIKYYLLQESALI